MVKKTLIILVLAASAWFGYGRYKATTFVPSAPEAVSRIADASPDPLAASAIQCDGRTMCSQMHSCDEATYFIQHCPDTKMDGDGDGVPCESQWCN
jgi:hypothetical protein